jgi:PAS domain S-box-containing protein
VGLIIGALLLVAASGAGLAWRQQTAKFYRSRYEMSEALRAVSQRQEALLAAVPDIIMEVNAGKVYTWANPAGLEFFGADVLGKGASDFFVGEQDTYEGAKPIFSGREDVLYVESWQRRKDGEKRLLAWWCRALEDERGRVTGALSSARDITEQKLAQEALNASEVRYRRLFEAAKDGILILDADMGTILDVNPFLIEMLGFSNHQFLGKRIWDLGLFGDIVDSQARFEELRRKEYVRYENLPLERADGRRLDVEFVSNVYKVGGQRVIQCNIRDITDRKRADEALAVQKKIGDIFLTWPGDEMYFEVLRVVLDVMKSPYGVFGYLDEEGALVVPSMTPHVWDKCEVPDKSIVFPRETWGDSSWPRAVKELRPNFSNEVSTKTPEGHARLTRHISLPILFKGAAIGLFQVANKETPYTEDDIRQLEAIAAYVAPVLSARLQRQRQEAELLAKNDELIRFTYTVSHDLKSPLVTIRTFLGYLEQDARLPDPAAIEKDLGYMRNAADKMSQLLDELLELSRIGRRINPSVEVTLQEVVQEGLDLVAGRISGRGVEVKVTQEPVRLWGDRVRLVEIFQNLIDNAVKFMGDERNPRIEIGAEREGDETVLFVRDNGMGIDLRHQPKLFNLFEKLDAESEGSGIGLALVRRIVEVHGGKIWVESPGPGQGTTFRFTLAKTKRPPRKKEVK